MSRIMDRGDILYCGCDDHLREQSDMVMGTTAVFATAFKRAVGKAMTASKALANALDMHLGAKGRL